jgi:acetylornithine deacetylase/succinyl-diaminopimelate desuccinylase-like protein
MVEVLAEVRAACLNLINTFGEDDMDQHASRNTSLLATVALGAMLALSGSARADGLTPTQQLAHDIYKELVEIDTTTATGDTKRAADAMAARLKAAGFPDEDVHVFSPAPHKGDLVATLHGTGKRKPILLVAHLDVVPANREDWSVDPFKLTEQDGYFYARGSSDDKYMGASFITNLIRYKQEGFKPDRDIIVAMETDEEILDANALGIQWLLKNHRDLIDAEFALNEGGSVGLKDGRAIRNSIQTAEKVSVSFLLEVKNSGGHSSVPRKDNAIYRLAGGLTRLANFDFPLHLTDTTRAFYARMAQLASGQIAADMKAVSSDNPDPAAIARLSANPGNNAQLRTTCVATMLQGGHAVNALPQLATAKVNCRIIPGEPVEEIKATLVRVLADDQISVNQIDRAVLSEPSKVNEELGGAIEKLTHEFWPDAVVVPVMSSGATDGSYLRNAGIPTFGHSGMANDINEFRAHGKDERVPIKSFYNGDEYLYRLVKTLSGGS